MTSLTSKVVTIPLLFTSVKYIHVHIRFMTNFHCIQNYKQMYLKGFYLYVIFVVKI